jgi:hypothetical protein
MLEIILYQRERMLASARRSGSSARFSFAIDTRSATASSRGYFSRDGMLVRGEQWAPHTPLVPIRREEAQTKRL